MIHNSCNILTTFRDWEREWSLSLFVDGTALDLDVSVADNEISDFLLKYYFPIPQFSIPILYKKRE